MLASALLAAAASGACASARPPAWLDGVGAPGAAIVAPGVPEPNESPPPAGGASAPAADDAPDPGAAPTSADQVVPTPVMAATLEDSSPLLRTRLAALAASPTPEAHLDVAAAYASYQVHDRAFDYLAAGLVLHPRHAGLHEALARLWRDWGMPDLALRHAHLAVRYAATSAAAHTTLGSVLWALDARAEAAQAFERAFALEPSAGYARYNWCTALAALQREQPFSCDTPYVSASPGKAAP